MQRNPSLEQKESSPAEEKNTSFYTTVKANADWLSRVLPVIEKLSDKAERTSRDFIEYIQQIISENSVQEEHASKQAIYLTWIKMLDPKLDQQIKEKLCDELAELQQQQYNQELGAILSVMASVITAPILLYSRISVLTSYHEHQREFGYHDQHFERTLMFFVNNTLFSEKMKIFFLKKIMNMLKQRMQEPFYQGLNKNYLFHEAMASWEKHALITDADDADFEWKAEHDLFKKKCHQAVKESGIGLKLSSELGSLVFKKLLAEHKYNAESLTPIVMQWHDAKDIPTLAEIYSAHQLNSSDMLKRHLVRLAELTKEPDHDAFSSLFFSRCLNYLPDREAISIASIIASFLPVDYYVKNAFAFTKIRKEMLLFWGNKKQIPAIMQAVLKKPKNYHATPIDNFFDELSHAKMPDEFYDTFADQCAILAPDQFILVYMAAPSAIQYKLLSARLVEKASALNHLKALNDAYKTGNFSALFLRTVASQLKIINPALYEQAKSETAFVEKEGIQSDLDSLKEILENKSQIQYHEQRLEIHKLESLRAALSDEKKGDCPIIVIQLFKNTPQIYWPDLFIHFFSQIVHSSFPYETRFAEELKLIPKKMTWLNFPDEWENILYGTLEAICLNLSKEDKRKETADQALHSFFYPAFTKTSKHFPGLTDKIFKAFFLKRAPESIAIFTAFRKQNSKMYDQVASWLPDDLSKRAALLVKLLRIGFKSALSPPFARNNDEVVETIFELVNTRTEHFIKLLEIFSDDIHEIIFKTLHQFVKEKFITLLQTSFSDLSKADIPTSSYMEFVIMLLSPCKNAKIDIFQIIDADDFNKQVLLQKLVDIASWASYKYSSPPFLFIFNIIYHYQPEKLQEVVFEHIKDNIKKNNVHAVCLCLVAAKKVSNDQFALPEVEKTLLITFLTKKMELVYEEDLDIMLKWIPNCDKLFLEMIAKEMKDEDCLRHKHKLYLDALVRMYGFTKINEQCVELKLEICSAYLSKQATPLPSLADSWKKSGLIASPAEPADVSSAAEEAAISELKPT